MKFDEQNRATMWSVSAGASYAHLKNENFTEPLVIDEILDLGLNLNHVRPISKRWSTMLSVGVGTYMATTRLSQIKAKIY